MFHLPAKLSSRCVRFLSFSSLSFSLFLSSVFSSRLVPSRLRTSTSAFSTFDFVGVCADFRSLLLLFFSPPRVSLPFRLVLVSSRSRSYPSTSPSPFASSSAIRPFGALDVDGVCASFRVSMFSFVSFSIFLTSELARAGEVLTELPRISPRFLFVSTPLPLPFSLFLLPSVPPSLVKNFLTPCWASRQPCTAACARPFAKLLVSLVRFEESKVHLENPKVHFVFSFLLRLIRELSTQFWYSPSRARPRLRLKLPGSPNFAHNLSNLFWHLAVQLHLSSLGRQLVAQLRVLIAELCSCSVLLRPGPGACGSCSCLAGPPVHSGMVPDCFFVAGCGVCDLVCCSCSRPSGLGSVAGVCARGCFCWRSGLASGAQQVTKPLRLPNVSCWHSLGLILLYCSRSCLLAFIVALGGLSPCSLATVGALGSCPRCFFKLAPANLICVCGVCRSACLCYWHVGDLMLNDNEGPLGGLDFESHRHIGPWAYAPALSLALQLDILIPVRRPIVIACYKSSAWT